MRTRWLWALLVFILAFTPALALAAPDTIQVDTNQPAYWEQYFETVTGHEASCYKHEAGSSTSHGYITDDGLAVVLNPFNPSWPGDHWEGLVVKGGSEDVGFGPGNLVYVHPEAGVRYVPPLNAGGQEAEVSHWIVCKGTTPDTTTTTTTPPTTTSTTTTTPVTTTTAVTTTTTPPTTTTTTPPTTTTSTSPPTTTTIPDDLNVDLFCEWDNKDADTGAHEPIISIWSYTDKSLYVGDRFAFAVRDRDGNYLGYREFGITSQGRHDSWVNTDVPVPEDGFSFDFLINNEVVQTIDDPDCKKDTPPVTTTTTQPPVTTTTTLAPECDEDHPTWNEETQNCELPFTGIDFGDIMVIVGIVFALAAAFLGAEAYRYGWRHALGIEDVDEAVVYNPVR